MKDCELHIHSFDSLIYRRSDWRRICAVLTAACLAVTAVWVQAASATAAKPLQIDVFTSGEKSFDVTSTLIYGRYEALLVDAQFQPSEAQKLADRIAAHKVTLKAIFITHPDDDHYFGLAVLHRRFPKTPIYMTSTALAEFKRTVADSLARQKRFTPADTPDSVPAPEALPTPEFLIDGQSITVVPDLQGDYADAPANSLLWIPSLRAVVAGDITFNGIHPWLSGSTEETRAAWRKSLARIAALRPRVVVSGHKRLSTLPDSPAVVTAMVKYLNDFDASKKTARNADELEAVMKRKHPGLGQERFLMLAAKASFPKAPSQHP